jgi:hypothetical protein
MRCWTTCAVLAGAACLLSAGRAGAGTAEDFAKRLMGRDPAVGVTYACFDRVYDAAHLVAHPQQNVQTMALLVKYTIEAHPAADETPQYELRIGVNFRKSKRMKEVDGECQSMRRENDANGPVTAHCGVACDGGSIDVALKDNGSVLLTIPDGARTWTPGADDKQEEEDAKVLHGEFGVDDKVFRLDRADIKQCLALAADKEEKAQMTPAH